MNSVSKKAFSAKRILVSIVLVLLALITFFVSIFYSHCYQLVAHRCAEDFHWSTTINIGNILEREYGFQRIANSEAPAPRPSEKQGEYCVYYREHPELHSPEYLYISVQPQRHEQLAFLPEQDYLVIRRNNEADALYRARVVEYARMRFPCSHFNKSAYSVLFDSGLYESGERPIISAQISVPSIARMFSQGFYDLKPQG